MNLLVVVGFLLYSCLLAYVMVLQRHGWNPVSVALYLTLQ